MDGAGHGHAQLVRERTVKIFYNFAILLKCATSWGVPIFMIAVLSLTRNLYDFCAGGNALLVCSKFQ